MSQTMAPEVGPKPLLRGWTHLVSFPVWLIVGVSMLLLTDTSPVGRALLSVYVGGTAIMFGVSAMYHRGRWQPRAKALMQKFDRSAIFLAIAGGYTPMAWVSLHGTIRVVVVAGAWVGAALGIALHWVPRVPRAWRGASYIIVSWTAVLVFPQMRHAVGATGFWLILIGGACYSVGALALATKWPNPWPKVFGFHEVFHALTVVAAALQFIAISSIFAPLM